MSSSFSVETGTVCESVHFSDVLASFSGDLFCFCFDFFFPLSLLVPLFFSSSTLALDKDNDRGGDCARDGWETCSLCSGVCAVRVSACFSSALLSRLFYYEVLKQKKCEK